LTLLTVNLRVQFELIVQTIELILLILKTTYEL